MRKTLILAACLLALAGCTRKQQPAPGTTRTDYTTIQAPAFDPDSAMAYAAAQVAFGHRVPGSQAWQRCGLWLESQLRRWCDTVVTQPFQCRLWDGSSMPGRNIIGSLNPQASQRVLLAAHRVALIGVTALLFFPTVFLFFRLYQRLFEPEAAQQRSAQEVFEAFCMHNDLSAREREVLRMVIDNRSNGEIAEALFITESTVKYHVRNVLQKAGCKNRGELQRKYTLALYPQLRSEAGLRGEGAR